MQCELRRLPYTSAHGEWRPFVLGRWQVRAARLQGPRVWHAGKNTHTHTPVSVRTRAAISVSPVAMDITILRVIGGAAIDDSAED